MRKPKLLYVARFIPFYREGILARLAAEYSCRFLCQDKEFGVGEAPKLPQLRRAPMKKWLGKFDWFSPRDLLNQFRPNVVISELGLSFLPVFFLVFGKMVWGYKLAFWTHGLEGPRKAGEMWLSDYVRRFLLNRSDAVIYYTESCARASHVYLQNPKYYVANNTLDTDKLNQAWDSLEKTSSFEGANYIVYMGRLVESKRMHDLIKLARFMKESGIEILIKVAGQGVLREELEAAVVKDSLNVQFLGEVIDMKQKAALLHNAIAGVCMGGVGLNVVDGLAFGLPMLTLSEQPVSCAHGPEVTYIEQGKCGWKCENVAKLAEKVNLLNKNVPLRVTMGEGCRKYFVENCSIDKQFAGFEEFVSDVFACSRVESAKS